MLSGGQAAATAAHGKNMAGVSCLVKSPLTCRFPKTWKRLNGEDGTAAAIWIHD